MCVSIISISFLRRSKVTVTERSSGAGDGARRSKDRNLRRKERRKNRRIVFLSFMVINALLFFCLGVAVASHFKLFTNVEEEILSEKMCSLSSAQKIDTNKSRSGKASYYYYTVECPGLRSIVVIDQLTDPSENQSLHCHFSSRGNLNHCNQ